MGEGDTIAGSSNVGKRLQKLPRTEALSLSYGGKAYPIVTQISIGRAHGNTIQLDDALVSRQHAIVQRIGNAFFVKDLGSTNGTFVNGKPVPTDKYVRLRRSDVLRVGRTDIAIS